VANQTLHLKALLTRNARPSINRSVPNILAQLSAEKQWVGGGGGLYYTRPSLPISITYKQEGVRIRVNKMPNTKYDMNCSELLLSPTATCSKINSSALPSILTINFKLI
jgi:hypothetical protein